MIVQTKEQLAEARKSKTAEIVIRGELAKSVHNGKKIVTMSKVALAAVGVAIAAIPFTGGGSAVGAAGVTAVASAAGLSGFEIGCLVAITFVGAALMLAVWKEYDEINFSQDPLELTLRRKSKD